MKVIIPLIIIIIVKIKENDERQVLTLCQIIKKVMERKMAVMPFVIGALGTVPK